MTTLRDGDLRPAGPVNSAEQLWMHALNNIGGAAPWEGIYQSPLEYQLVSPQAAGSSAVQPRVLGSSSGLGGGMVVPGLFQAAPYEDGLLDSSGLFDPPAELPQPTRPETPPPIEDEPLIPPVHIPPLWDGPVVPGTGASGGTLERGPFWLPGQGWVGLKIINRTVWHAAFDGLIGPIASQAKKDKRPLGDEYVNMVEYYNRNVGKLNALSDDFLARQRRNRSGLSPGDQGRHADLEKAVEFSFAHAAGVMRDIATAFRGLMLGQVPPKSPRQHVLHLMNLMDRKYDAVRALEADLDRYRRFRPKK